MPYDQMWLFPNDCIAFTVICDEFEQMYPGTKYYLSFERNPLCEEEI